MSDTRIYHWVIVSKNENYFAIGPYNTEEGARNRYENTKGKAYLFQSTSHDPKVAISELKEELTK